MMFTEPIKDARDAIRIVRRYIELDYNGPNADFPSFEPISVKFNDSDKKWIVICKFKKQGEIYKAKIEVDSTTGNIMLYEVIE